MIKKQLFSYIFTLLTIAPLWGMDQSRVLQPVNRSIEKALLQPITKPTTRFTSNYKENYPYLVNKAYEDENLENYAVEQFVFNQDESIKKMNAAKARGANIYLTVGAHSENKMDKYIVTKAKRDTTIHGKLTVGIDQSPSKKTPTKGTLLFGSANTTNSTWQHKPGKAGDRFNFESGIEIKDDMDLIPQAYTMVKSQSPMKQAADKKTILLTPKKNSIYSSKDTNLNESLALRLSNAAKKHGTVAVRSMTFNDQKIADELSKFGPNAELVVDYSALSSKGIPLLKQLADSNVPVYVFYPKQGSRAKQHAKDVIIETDDKKTYISSTANLTAEGDKQRNYQLYIANDDKIMADAKEDFDRVKKESITLEQALEYKKEEDKKKTEKRRLEEVATKEATIKTKKVKK